MLVKILGAVLLLIGLLLALKFFLKVIWVIGSVAFVAGLIYAGWRLLNRTD